MLVPVYADTSFLVSLYVQNTETLGARGMDILHVASALALKARRFVTADERQRELARLAGLDAP